MAATSRPTAFASTTCAMAVKGPALILIPGITSPAITWGFVAERLGEHFDTYVLDVRGRGLSSTGPELDYSADACADDIGAFAKAMKLDSYHLVGHSMGARFAVRSAVRHPAGVNRLVLIDPPVSGPGRREYPSKLPWYVDSIRQSLIGMDAEAMRAFCATWTDEQLQLRAEWLHTCYEPAIVRAFNDFHDVDFHQDLPKLPGPGPADDRRPWWCDSAPRTKQKSSTCNRIFAVSTSKTPDT